MKVKAILSRLASYIKWIVTDVPAMFFVGGIVLICLTVVLWISGEALGGIASLGWGLFCLSMGLAMDWGDVPN